MREEQGERNKEKRDGPFLGFHVMVFRKRKKTIGHKKFMGGGEKGIIDCQVEIIYAGNCNNHWESVAIR